MIDTTHNAPKQPMINWTPDMLKRFKRAQKTALAKEGKDGTFTFDGHEFVVGYAGYLIEYLNTLFNGHKRKNKVS